MRRMPRQFQIMFIIGCFICYVLKYLFPFPELIRGIGSGLIIASAILCVIFCFTDLEKLRENKRKLFIRKP